MDNPEMTALADRLESFWRILNGAMKSNSPTVSVWASDTELVAEAAKALRLAAAANAGAVKVPEGQTPLNDKPGHRYLDVIQEGATARDNGVGSPYHGHSLEHCLHAVGWVQRDLFLALDKAKRPALTPEPVKAGDEVMREALEAVAPYLDAITCYASTINEHDGNHVAVLVRKALSTTAPQPDNGARGKQSAPAEPQPEVVEPVKLTYTNYRGETAERTIVPKSVRFGYTEWHPEPQWLLLAWDADKRADREFALKDFGLPITPDTERMRRALEVIESEARNFHSPLAERMLEIRRLAKEALSRADEGKESEGGKIGSQFDLSNDEPETIYDSDDNPSDPTPAEQREAIARKQDVDHWSVTINVNGEQILCIGSNCLSGAYDARDYDDTIRTCARHLLGFIGEST